MLLFQSKTVINLILIKFIVKSTCLSTLEFCFVGYVLLDYMSDVYIIITLPKISYIMFPTRSNYVTDRESYRSTVNISIDVRQ